MLAPSYRVTDLIRKGTIYLMAKLVMLTKKQNQVEVRNKCASAIYGSFLGNLKLIVSLPSEFYAVIRPYKEDPLIIHEIFEQKVYETFFSPAPGDTVIDIGAHIGLFTIRAAKMVGSRTRVAVEPHPENYKLLVTDVRLSDASNNVIPLKVALGDREGFTNLFLDSFSGHSSMIVERRKYIKVPIITLDQLIMKLGIRRVDFVKIDVKGAEHHILKGAKNTLKSNNVRLAIEVHGEVVEKKVTSLLEELRYKNY